MFLMVTDCCATTVGTVNTLLSELSSLSDPEEASAAIVNDEEERRKRGWLSSARYKRPARVYFFVVVFTLGRGPALAWKIVRILAYFTIFPFLNFH